MAEDLVVGFTTIESLKRCFSQVKKNPVANLKVSCSGCCSILTVLTDICTACCFFKAVQRVGLIGLAIGQPNKASGQISMSKRRLGHRPWARRGMAKQARTRIYGNDAIDSMPELVQEWYHAVGTPMGVGNMAWAKECVKKGVDVNARLDAYGGTALFLAIEQGNWPMVKWLVEEAQVDMQVLDYGGYNALDYAAACHWHHPDRPPMLADGKLAPMDIASYLKSQGMKYTWFGAALAEDIDRLWEFLDNGQDVNERGGHFNKSALEEAADNGGYWTAKFLMVKGAQVSVTPNWIYAMAPESSCTANIQGKLGK